MFSLSASSSRSASPVFDGGLNHAQNLNRFNELQDEKHQKILNDYDINKRPENINEYIIKYKDVFNELETLYNIHINVDEKIYILNDDEKYIYKYDIPFKNLEHKKILLIKLVIDLISGPDETETNKKNIYYISYYLLITLNVKKSFFIVNNNNFNNNLFSIYKMFYYITNKNFRNNNTLNINLDYNIYIEPEDEEEEEEDEEDETEEQEIERNKQEYNNIYNMPNFENLNDECPICYENKTDINYIDFYFKCLDCNNKNIICCPCFSKLGAGATGAKKCPICNNRNLMKFDLNKIVETTRRQRQNRENIKRIERQNREEQRQLKRNKRTLNIYYNNTTNNIEIEKNINEFSFSLIILNNNNDIKNINIDFRTLKYFENSFLCDPIYYILEYLNNIYHLNSDEYRPEDEFYKMVSEDIKNNIDLDFLTQSIKNIFYYQDDEETYIYKENLTQSDIKNIIYLLGFQRANGRRKPGETRDPEQEKKDFLNNLLEKDDLIDYVEEDEETAEGHGSRNALNIIFNNEYRIIIQINKNFFICINEENDENFKNLFENSVIYINHLNPFNYYTQPDEETYIYNNNHNILNMYNIYNDDDGEDIHNIIVTYDEEEGGGLNNINIEDFEDESEDEEEE